MSAYRFYLDAEGYVCRGEGIDPAVSGETWSLAHIPNVPPANIVFPKGEHWTLDDMHVGYDKSGRHTFDDIPNETERAA